MDGFLQPVWEERGARLGAQAGERSRQHWYLQIEVQSRCTQGLCDMFVHLTGQCNELGLRIIHLNREIEESVAARRLEQM